jgi:hypothetical protein
MRFGEAVAPARENLVVGGAGDKGVAMTRMKIAAQTGGWWPRRRAVLGVGGEKLCPKMRRWRRGTT